MNKMQFTNYLNKFSDQLPNGVFLTSEDSGKVNTMTIGWGTTGIIWSKPMVTVLVRYSRYTYELIKKSNEFTLSIPFYKDMKNELTFCGTKSGRDVDKFASLDMKKIYVDGVKPPMIKGCEFHFTCKKVYQQSMEPSLINADFVSAYYKDNDYHVLFTAEVTGVYTE